MSRVRCPACGEVYGVSDDLAGQVIKCRRCKAAVEVPGDTEREPLSYRVLGGLSRLFLVLSGIGVLVTLTVGLVSMFSLPSDTGTARSILLAAVLWAGYGLAAFAGCAFTFTFALVILDMARNIRAMRRQGERDS
jgi:hypothetical protein